MKFHYLSLVLSMLFTLNAACSGGHSTNASVVKSFPNGTALWLWEGRRELDQQQTKGWPANAPAAVNLVIRLTLTNSVSGESETVMQRECMEWAGFRDARFEFFDATRAGSNLYVLYRHNSVTTVEKLSSAGLVKAGGTNAPVELWKDIQADGQVVTSGNLDVTNSMVVVALKVANLGERRWILDDLKLRDVSTNNPNIKTYVPYPHREQPKR